jgi:Taurine catabolism dioxygenase TauD, TfdA family
MLDNSVIHKWEKGNFMYVDNTVAYHSRLPYKGRRMINAAVANGLKPVTFTQTSLVLTSGDNMPAMGLGLCNMPKEDC